MTRYNRHTGYDEDGSFLEALGWAGLLGAIVWGFILAGFFFGLPWLVAIVALVLE